MRQQKRFIGTDEFLCAWRAVWTSVFRSTAIFDWNVNPSFSYPASNSPHSDCLGRAWMRISRFVEYWLGITGSEERSRSNRVPVSKLRDALLCVSSF